MAKGNLSAQLMRAKRNKKDEFYTRLEDIERELAHYKEHFRDKTVLCNCDDPRVSNFSLFREYVAQLIQYDKKFLIIGHQNALTYKEVFPLAFMYRCAPKQFEIVGATESEGKGFSCGLWDASSGVAQPLVDGARVYKRIFIRRRAAAD